MHATIQGVDRSVRSSDIGGKLSDNEAFSSHLDSDGRWQRDVKLLLDMETPNGSLKTV